MKKLLFVLIPLLLLAGCEASDPLTEGVYNSNGFYVVDGGHLSRESASGNGGYWHEYALGAIELSPGASGATLVAPNASSLGGYQLNAINEYLYFDSHVENDWDMVSSGLFEIYFEVNDDNTAGLVTDTVKFQLEVWRKLHGELTNTVFSLQGNTVVGQSQQHELFEQQIAVGNIRMNEVIAFRLNLNTIQSQVTDVIVNYVEFKYPTYYPAPER
jgi:regulator of sigma D